MKESKIKKEYNFPIRYQSPVYDEDILEYYSESTGGEELGKQLITISELEFGGNFISNVAFIPKINTIDEEWPPKHDENNLKTIEDLKKSYLYSGLYRVMPSDILAGEVRVIDGEEAFKALKMYELPEEYWGEKHDVTVFFVSKNEFNIFSQDIEKIKELSKNDLEKGIIIEELKQCTTVVSFIENRIIPCLSDIDLSFLKRKRLGDGRIVEDQESYF